MITLAQQPIAQAHLASPCRWTCNVRITLNFYRRLCSRSCSFLDHPSITKISKDGWHMKNSRLTLHCEADGSPPPVYTWSWKGRNVTNSTAGMIVLGSGRSLVVKRVTGRFSGRFTCFVSNRVGTRSGVVKIEVMGEPNGMTETCS